MVLSSNSLDLEGTRLFTIRRPEDLYRLLQGLSNLLSSPVYSFAVSILFTLFGRTPHMLNEAPQVHVGGYKRNNRTYSTMHGRMWGSVEDCIWKATPSKQARWRRH
jgi:hypothetical protein